MINKWINKIFLIIKTYWLPLIVCIISLSIIDFLLGSVCYSAILIGIPCPGCGITRATKLMITGHFQESLQMHPLLILIIIGVILYPILRMKLKNYRFFVNSYIIVCILIFICFYIYRMLRFYPNVEPMIYKEDNLLFKARTFISYLKEK